MRNISMDFLALRGFTFTRMLLYSYVHLFTWFIRKILRFVRKRYARYWWKL